MVQMNRRFAAAAIASLGMLSFTPEARAADPIRIGVIAEGSAIGGAAILNASRIAADEINAAGGVNGRKIELFEYDNHNSAADAVRAFQRAVNQDRVHAMVTSYISEVVLALQPWAARLKMPMITPGAASDQITKRVHDEYDKYKYVFHGYLSSTQIADAVCDAGRDILIRDMKVKKAVIVSEDQAWSLPLDDEYVKCLPKIGVEVLDKIRLAPGTTDFSPIFKKVEALKPDVMVTGISLVGVQPTSQWHQLQVPIPMYGVSGQANTSTFWKDTNGGADGVIYLMVAAPDVAVTPKTIPFAEAYIKRYGKTPAHSAYAAYDDVYIIADAIRRTGSTDPDKIVEGMESTDWVGTIGRVQFLPKDNKFAHGLRMGPGYVTGLMLQWQDGKQVAVWPDQVATGKLKFPAFIKASP
jgi:branched-chain amino acid transport system substrate-binding protein